MPRPFLTYMLPATGLEMPTGEQLRALRRIVLSTHGDWLGGGEGSELNQEQAFRRAFWAVGRFFRRRQVRHDRFFHDWVAAANSRLEENGASTVDGRDIMLGILAHCDVPWQRPNTAQGVLPEIGVDEFSGLPCSNAWRQLLTGEANLLPPTPPRGAAPLLEADRAPRPRLFQERDGRMQEIPLSGDVRS